MASVQDKSLDELLKVGSSAAGSRDLDGRHRRPTRRSGRTSTCAETSCWADRGVLGDPTVAAAGSLSLAAAGGVNTGGDVRIASGDASAGAAGTVGITVGDSSNSDAAGGSLRLASGAGVAMGGTMTVAAGLGVRNGARAER